MSEIEKMYKNAGIKPIKQGYCDWDSDCPYPDIINNGCGDECPYWKYEDEAKYPPFTAEKQLKILCFIVNNKHSVTFHDQVFSGDKLTLEKMQEDLAWAINRIWQDLTEEEKQQVKGILE